MDSTKKVKKWYEEFDKGTAPFKNNNKSDIEIMNLQDEAKKCLDSESNAYQIKQTKSNSSEYSWLKTACTKGTMSDKVAGNIVLIQNSPKHHLNNLKNLVSQVKIAKHNQCRMLITSLRDLFLSDLLHPDHKLLKFHEQNFEELENLNKGLDNINVMNTKKRCISRHKLLALWYFEDQLKDLYEQFISAVAKIANDTVNVNREQAIIVMNSLLMGNPEQEQKLLDFLINKIGDPNNKVASKAIYCLNKLLHEHPNMKFVVLKEIEKFLFRTNIAVKAQYFAICLLTQFVLSNEDSELASYMINVYFAFFKACLKKGEPDTKMMAAVLTGVNRAFPFAKLEAINIKDHIDSVYKIVHVGSYHSSLNALNLLLQLVGKDEAYADRFYRALYRKLLDFEILNSTKQAMFLNLLYRALRKDTSELRLHAFIKRTLTACLHYPANLAGAALYTLSQVMKARKFTKKIRVLSDFLSEDYEERFREKVERYRESLTKGSDDVSEKTTDDKVDDSVQLDESIMQDNEESDNENNCENMESITLPNVVHEPIIEKIDEDMDVKVEEQGVDKYNPNARNPLFAGANHTYCYELVALKRHYHPTVAIFAKTILQKKPIEYSGDPLKDLSLMRFLDRFAYKNPKKFDSKESFKKNNPMANRCGYTPKGVRQIPVDSLHYISQKEEDIPPEEKFLYDFMRKRRERLLEKQMKNDDEDDNSSVNSEEFHELLDKMSGQKLEEEDFAEEIEISAKQKEAQKQKKSSKTEDEDDDEDSDDNMKDLYNSEDEDENDLDDDDDIDYDDEDSDLEGLETDGDENSDLETMERSDDDGDEENDDLPDLEEFNFDDDDASDIEFGSDGEDFGSDDDIFKEMPSTSKKQSKRKQKQASNKNKKTKGFDQVFMPAEEFSDILENKREKKFKHGSSKALRNIDGAKPKQLDWETERNNKVAGYRAKKKNIKSQPTKFKNKKTIKQRQSTKRNKKAKGN